jgi:accessory gene regulator B
MINRLSCRLTDFICTEAYNNPKDRAKIQYGLNVFLSEGFKFTALLLLFHAINYQSYFYFSLCILITIRVFAGGIHVKGTLNCLLLTVLLFLFTSILAPLVPKLHSLYYLSISMLSFAVLAIRAPVCSASRPIKDSKKRLQFKITAVLITAVWSIVLLCIQSPAYINCGFSTILVQNMQLIWAKHPNP